MLRDCKSAILTNRDERVENAKIIHTVTKSSKKKLIKTRRINWPIQFQHLFDGRFYIPKRDSKLFKTL